MQDNVYCYPDNNSYVNDCHFSLRYDLNNCQNLELVGSIQFKSNFIRFNEASVHVIFTIFDEHKQYANESFRINLVRRTRTIGSSFFSNGFISRKVLIETIKRNQKLYISCEIKVIFSNKDTKTNQKLVALREMEDTDKIAKTVSEIKSDCPSEFGELLKNKKLCDVKLFARGGEEFPAHKAILAARSPVLSLMFEDEMKERQENVVEMEDVEPKVLQTMLEYMYTGTCKRLDELGADVLPVAEKYQIKGLKEQCEAIISHNLTVKSAVQILVIADMYNAAVLGKSALDFIVRNGRAVIGTSEFKTLKKSHPHLLENILCKLLEE